MFSVASVRVSVRNALTFKSLDLESSFFVRRYIFRISRSSSYIKVIGSRSRSQEQKNVSTVVHDGCVAVFDKDEGLS